MVKVDKKKQILIVDDEASILENLSAFLERSGFDDVKAENGKIEFDRLSKISLV